MRRLLAILLVFGLTAMGQGRDLTGISLHTSSLQQTSLGEVIESQPLTLLNFWATWCAPCRDELPVLLHADLGPEMTLYAVNLGESPTQINNYLANNNLTELPVLYLTARNSARLPIPGLPSSLLIDQQGNVLYTHYGAFTQESLSSFLADWSDSE